MTANNYNMNDEVRVKLTDAGRKHYEAYVLREAKKFGIPVRQPLELTASGCVEFTLWDFINIFGDGSPHFNGGPCLFENNSLHIRERD